MYSKRRALKRYIRGQIADSNGTELETPPPLWAYLGPMDD